MLTYNNWYRWQWADGSCGLKPPSDSFQSWVFNPAISSIRTLSFEDAVYDALEKIAHKNKQLVVMYSGGLDSEIILYAAQKIGVKIIPAIIRFDGGLNDHDLFYVNNYLNKFSVKDFIYLDINIDDWMTLTFDHSLVHLAERYGFVHVATPLYFWARKQLKEIVGECTVINGSGDLPLARIPNPTNIFEAVPYACFAIDSQQKRLMISQQLYSDDVPLFFVYTPELVQSFMLEPEILEFERNFSKLSITSLRRQLFTRIWPELDIRKKFTGFERVKSTFPVVNSTYKNSMATYTNIEYGNFKRLLGI